MNNKKMTLMEHFAELRRRFLWCVFIFLVFFVLGWYVAPCVQEFLTKPLLKIWNGNLLYNGITDGLMIRLSLSVTVAILLSIPVVLWHVWAFVAPGLKKNEKNFIWPIMIASPILFLIGAGFAFYVLFPFVFGFFIELNQSSSVPSIILLAVRDYLTFAIRLLKVFGIAFQLPVIMILLNRIGVLSRARVVAMRRYAIILIVIAAAVLTPPDVVSQILLAVPMWALFEISILFMRGDTNK
ncbi:MAG: twin-arginine translocase subunit TatC [Alphaproteobacteria bacterium]|nr:twin-arginine translocase subunit TatC [Alphaproteobacteria bacterium]